MTRIHRPRRLALLALAGVAALALAACSSADYPNSIFTKNSDTNTDIGHLFNRLFLFGTIVFVLVEALLLYVIMKFRRKPDHPEPEHVHGNTTLEVLWTAIPAVILIFIAVPTVRTIFRTQAKARPNALTVEVIGHQWWWEFRYPEYKITTANELYIPAGRTVNFELKTADVIHSFWIPALSGKRDVMPNHTNFIWFTPDSALGAQVWNGHCAEYCGTSHANMKFRAYTVTAEQFDSWVRGQQAVAAFGAAPSPAQSAAPTSPGDSAAARATASQAGAPAAVTPSSAAGSQQAPTVPAGAAPGAAPGAAGAQLAAGTPNAPAATTAGYVFPVENMPLHTRPQTPTPDGLSIAAGLQGDATRGQQVYSRSACIGCHFINGNPSSMGQLGPNLTHVGSRHTIAGGLFPNDARHLALWIKNARWMKPGVSMPTLGLNQRDPIMKSTVTKATGGLSDQEIVDIVAYLQALK
ncbi:cytochrome c oxidase, subunit II [Gemmatirosa kalamazoonensis]|uniref:Cytochrome c oxidase subunit 2 n=1 Tax=Gemmatirosa kalamazoonensis TaxID=861299 RepID=W0RFQ9_9BACT|nr:cytochrome c oxidase subunit II [Gemmatirosa kalamazoonensis]AHG89944.1 cytochrome c oxidase, subunit II [Gemmatirosa kalamazoonensis]